MTRAELEKRYGTLRGLVAAGLDKALADKQQIERTWLVNGIMSTLAPAGRAQGRLS